MQQTVRVAAAALVAIASVPAVAAAQRHASRTTQRDIARPARLDAARDSAVVDTLPTFRARTDSLMSARARAAAVHDRSLRVVISIADRQLWVVDGADTLRTAVVAVGMGRLLEYGGRKWVFATPLGVRTVIAKSESPKWRPPDWAYAEVAREYRLKLAQLPSRGVTLRDGRKLVVRDSLVGLMLRDGFAALPVDEHIVFDSTLYVPPLGTANRRIDGELGNYRLDMGGGYLLHGTPSGETPRSATTHGCVRLGDDDLQWLYEFVPVGTKVYIY